ncbi:Syntaxin 6, N-terminal [Sesbania bispinosa]|nr:Syntaxin 6, N-terminal [Sesbania bispinosa]
MASSFDRWEQDPFFNAAEEVQESADRMESTYRTWIHAKEDSSSPWNSDELRRDLHTALGTAKWQLDEFERAVRSSYSKSSSEDARNRHQDFIVAIDDKISKVEHLLQESAHSGSSKASMHWVSLDEGERNELALFLSGMPAAGGKTPIKCVSRDGENPQLSNKDPFSNCSSNLLVSSGWGSSETVEEKSHGLRRVASADADMSSWKIAVSDDAQQPSSSNGSSYPMHKVASLSGFLSSMESISKLKWPKNGYRKLKAVNHHQETDNAPLPSTNFNPVCS